MFELILRYFQNLENFLIFFSSRPGLGSLKFLRKCYDSVTILLKSSVKEIKMFMKILQKNIIPEIF